MNAAEMFSNGSYLSQGATHEYNSASTTRLTANSAGVDLDAYRANTSSRFDDYGSYIFLRPLSLDEYVISSGSSASSTSSADYGSSSGGFSGSPPPHPSDGHQGAVRMRAMHARVEP